MIVKGRCAFMSRSCYQLPAKGTDPKSMPHMCGPWRMGLGWWDSGKEREEGEDLIWVRGNDSEEPRIVLEKHVKMDKGVVSLAELFEKLDCEQDRRTAAGKGKCNFKRQVVEGGRNLKMVKAAKQREMSRPGCKPLRLKLENFKRVGLKYPPSEMQCKHWKRLD